jgi:hypothetical protein
MKRMTMKSSPLPGTNLTPPDLTSDLLLLLLLRLLLLKPLLLPHQ